MRLASLPLSANGKLDRRALPAPGGEAFGVRGYEAPRGELEQQVASIWADLLRVERVGRDDNFFALGGHSLLAVTLVERMRRAGLHTDVRTVFSNPNVAGLAQALAPEPAGVEVPPNLIPADAQAITPEMLTLVKLNQPEIDRLVATVPGGAANVQDIYPLAPLQEGILFHHLLARQGDAYLTPYLLGFASREALDRFAAHLQSVVQRHDILRTAVFWEGLDEPVQVVLRRATLEIETVALDPAAGDPVEQLKGMFDPRHYRLDLGRAPLLRAVAAADPIRGRWLLLVLIHHLVDDATSINLIAREIACLESGDGAALPAPVPFRRFVAEARLGVPVEEHTRFFGELLGDVDEPTAPFGLLEVRGDGSTIGQARRLLHAGLSAGLREQARELGVSVASLIHLAWALVVARASARQDVVFGTVMFGRLQGGQDADRMLGPFINTVPARLRLTDSPVVAAVRETHQVLARLMRHEHAPLALAQRCSRVPAGTPLFSSLLNYRHRNLVADEPSGLDADAAEAAEDRDPLETFETEERTNYPLTLSVDDFGDAIMLTAQVSASVDAQRVCGFMETALSSLLDALRTAPATPVRSLEVLPPDERHQVLEGWNATQTEELEEQRIEELFEAQARATPTAAALISGDQTISYAELDGRASRLANHLRELGVGPETRVAVAMHRSPEMVVALLATMKAGGAYVPLDPSYPRQRLQEILEDCAPAALLTHRLARAELPVELGTLPIVDVDDDDQAGNDHEAADGAAPVRRSARDLAYVIYTSGSTGRPKGAMNEHRSVVNRLLWLRRLYGLGPGDVFLQKTPYTFDVSVGEIFGPLISGARLVIARPEGHKDPAYLAELIESAGVNVVHFVPSMLRAFLEHPAAARCTGLRRMMCSGEALPAALVELAHQRLPAVEILNLYGPTEAAVEVTAWVCDPQQPRSPVPIGRPIANARIYVLTADLQPAPIGVAGELMIAGVPVGRGYLNRPELTAERFVADPFVDQEGARMYRTGDLARWLPDGTLEYLGRNDGQVKLRGLRIELGEIEAHLARVPGVREAVVVMREDRLGDQRLVAYYTGPDAPDEGALRDQLALSLPAYMVPGTFLRLEALPLTASGKTDRKALPAPQIPEASERGFVPPRGVIEESLAAIWGEVLGVTEIGRHDDFFALGGHSLLALTVIERMRRVGLTANVRSLFDHPTLAALAAAVASGGREIAVPPNLIPDGATVITPEMLTLVQLDQGAIDRIVARVPGGAGNVQDVYPLAPLQEGILFQHLMSETGDLYLVPHLLAFPSRARLDRFLATLQAVVDRHDVLRTAILWDGLEQPLQVVLREAPLIVESFVEDPGSGAIADQLKRRYDPRRHRIDVGRAPLLRAVVAHDEPEARWLLLLLAHHLVIDNTAAQVLVEEVDLIEAGRAAELPPPVPFRNFVGQALQAVPRQEHEAFFQRLLGDVEEPTAPFGLLDVQGDGAGLTQAHRWLDPSVAAAARQQARQLGVGVASLVHLAWAMVLARVASRRDVVFGTVLSGRLQAGAGAERGLGMFINTLPVRLDVGGLGTAQGVRQIHGLLAELIRHEHASLILAQRCSRVPASMPLFSALLNYRHAAQAVVSQPPAPNGESTAGGAFDPLADEAGVETLWAEDLTNFPVVMSVDDAGSDLLLTAQVAHPVDPERLCVFVESALAGLVAALAETPEKPLTDIDVLPRREHDQVLSAWNRTAALYPRDRAVHELVQAQALRTPDAVAVVHGGDRLTYRELDRRARRLSARLARRGVGPGTRVGICLERGVDMVVALLGTLVAGATYVPLDPAHPAERLAMIGDDADLAVVVSQRALRELPWRAPVLEIDAPGGDRRATAPASAQRRAAGEVAYLLYTSGSTGRPKGVEITHRSLVNFLSSMAVRPGLDAGDVVVSVTTLSFDIAGLEIWLPLTVGARVVVASREDASDGNRLAALLDRSEATLLQGTPATWKLLQHAGWRGRPTLKMLCGGEALPPDLAAWLLPRGASLWNMYGPTETTIWSSVERVQQDGKPIGIGEPIANTQLYVLDQAMRLAPLDVWGELFIGGDGVARGYWNRPELTAERFVPNPFGAGRLYRTGDLVRRRADGKLEFGGRTDHQVKVRGFRIELGEVEARLATAPGVEQVVVVVRGEPSGGNRLIAYLSGDGARDTDGLRAHARAALPDYMVPSAFVALDSWPLTPNGKIDRRALPAVEGLARSGAHEPPRGELEERVARIWGELLGVERVGRNDDFLNLGGHSLLAVQMVSRVRSTLGVDATVRDLFGHPTLADFAAAVGGLSSRTPPSSPLIPIRPEGTWAPLFMVHEATGSVEYARALAPHLDPRLPVYGLAPAGLRGGEAVSRSVPEMVAAYVAAVRAVHPHGPYRLLGWSAGGVIAYAMAARLVEEGETVAWVGVVDSYADPSGIGGWSELAARVRAATDPARKDALILQREVSATAPAELQPELAALADAGDVPGMLAALKRAGSIGDELDDQLLHRMVQVATATFEAVADYRLPQVAAPITLFRAEGRQVEDPTLGWRAVAGDRLQVVDVPGSHATVMSPPHVGALAAAIAARVAAPSAAENA
ncbi:MAG TPA: amino acid adenylation domain-containing protein [Polyangia bacterium]|nr:amino acid adenylation domain-containing protein [Polyangia bacterium]